MEIFSSDNSISQLEWRIVDDVVMGGRSQGKALMNAENQIVFSGTVSLENNGGFSSLRGSTGRLNAADYSKIRLKVKGDGKRYQFRIKESSRDWQSYITYFETNGEWQVIDILMGDLYPTFRGRKLSMPNFSGDQIEEFSFLISNKKAETFTLTIDSVELIK